MVALSSDLSDVQKSRTDQEEAKRTAEETIERERKEHDEKVRKLFFVFVCFLRCSCCYSHNAREM